MKIPKDVSGKELAKQLEKVGYHVTRQTGSHMRLTLTGEEEHHVTIPKHKSLKIGMLHNILKDVADHLGMSKKELVERLWRK